MSLRKKFYPLIVDWDVKSQNKQKHFIWKRSNFGVAFQSLFSSHEPLAHGELL